MNEKKSEQVNIRLTPTHKAQAEELAQKERRPLGQYLGLIITDYLEGLKNE